MGTRCPNALSAWPAPLLAKEGLQVFQPGPGGVPMFFVKRWEYFSSLLLAGVFGRGVSTGFQGTTADVGVLSGRFSRGRFVKHSVPQHREQDIAAATGEGDKGLVVPFALRPFTVVVVP